MNDIEKFKKNALIVTELNANTKTQISTSEIAKLSQEIKRIITKKDVVVIVHEK